MVALLVGLGLVLLFMLLLRSSEQTPRPAPIAPSPTLPTTVVPASAPTPSPVSVASVAALPTADPNVVAIVNGERIGQDALKMVLGVDRAMAAVLGTEAPATGALERLINDVLMLQAAQQAGFSVPETEIEQALNTFLSQQQLSPATLQPALAAEGLTWEQFRAYFGQLITVDRFARQQAQAQGLELSAYLSNLQRQAHISYGAAADMEPPSPIASPTLMPSPTVTRLVSLPGDDAATILERLGAATGTPPPTAAGARGLERGQLAPDFSLSLLGSESGEVLSWSDLRGQPTVLSFWTTWCPYCRQQTPNLVAGYERWAAKNVRFVGIDVKEAAGVVAAYVAQNHILYPIVLDTDGAVAERYNVRGFPTTLFLDAEGRVFSRQIGVLTKEKLNAVMIQILDAD